MKKRMLSMLIAIVMVVGLLPAMALATNEPEWVDLSTSVVYAGGVELEPDRYYLTVDGVPTTEGAGVENYNLYLVKNGEGEYTLYLNKATIGGAEFEINWSYLVGIFAVGSLTLELSAGNTITTGNGDDTISITRGIYVSPISDEFDSQGGGDLTIKGTGSLEIKAGDAPESQGIYATSLALESGNVTANGGTATNGTSTGVQADSIFLSGGSLNTMGGEATDTSSGVQASHSIIVSGGSLEATGGDTNEAWGSSYGVKNGSEEIPGEERETSDIGNIGLSIVLSGGSLEVVGRTGISSVGVEADSITVSGGVLTARSDYTGTGEKNFGVQADVTISGGEIIAKGGKKAFDFEKNLTITETFTYAMVWYGDNPERYTDYTSAKDTNDQDGTLTGAVTNARYVRIATAIQVNWSKQGNLTVRNYEIGENDSVEMIIMVAAYTGHKMKGCQVIEKVTGNTVIPLTINGDIFKVFFLNPGNYAPLTVYQTKDMKNQNQ